MLITQVPILFPLHRNEFAPRKKLFHSLDESIAHHHWHIEWQNRVYRLFEKSILATEKKGMLQIPYDYKKITIYTYN